MEVMWVAEEGDWRVIKTEENLLQIQRYHKQWKWINKGKAVNKPVEALSLIIKYQSQAINSLVAENQDMRDVFKAIAQALDKGNVLWLKD